MTALSSDRKATLTTPTDEQILVVREFDAPRHLVYRAYTEPELVRRWWHAKRGRVTNVEIDLRVGGAWRYAMTASDGDYEVAFHGEYLEIVPDERLVTTELYEGMPDAPPTRNTATFAEADGRTTLTLLMECASRELRDTILATGMEDGLQDALELLEETTASLG